MSSRIDKYNICVYCRKRFKVANWDSHRKYCSRECVFSDDLYRKKLNKSLKGRPKSEEHKRKLSIFRTGKPGLKGKDNPAYKPELHTKKKCPTCSKLFEWYDTKNYNKTTYCSMDCVRSSPEVIRKSNEKRALDRKLHPEKYKRISKNISNAMKDKLKSDEHKKKLSESKQEMWNNLTQEQRVNRLKHWWNQRTPNKKEELLDKLLTQWYGDKFRFVGDGKIFIGNMVPDFIGHGKLIIELFGDYWHKPEDEDKRATHFAKYGYKTLVVWENELCNKNLVKQKVESFING